jgi:hypothetical protein
MVGQSLELHSDEFSGDADRGRTPLVVWVFVEERRLQRRVSQLL